MVPRAQVLAEMQARQEKQERAAQARAAGLGVAEEPIAQDSGCGGNSLWLFSTTKDTHPTQGRLAPRSTRPSTT